jgi:hypothetical protein
MDKTSRALAYITKMGPAISGCGGHTHTLAVARVLVRGFLFSESEALSLLLRWNSGNDEQWTERELIHKIRSAMKGPAPQKGEGWLARDDRAPSCPLPEKEIPPAPTVDFCPDKLAALAGEFATKADLIFFAERSEVDPCTVDSSGFLDRLYNPGEKVLVFTSEYSQGDAVWPDDRLPREGRCGVWFLCQPVDGNWRPVSISRREHKPKMSRRVMECVTEFRYMLLESDKADAAHWMGALARMPLRIAAIYTSGARSIHALVRVDARSNAAWDAQKRKAANGLKIIGADPGAMSGVRLSRLPGCVRHGKMVDVVDAGGCKVKKPDGSTLRRYQKFPEPQDQKLIYLCSRPEAAPICEMPRRRRLVEEWATKARVALINNDLAGLAAAQSAADYYRRESEEMAAMSAELRQMREEICHRGELP